MAEQIISPGVFTRENDLSFLPQGIGQIGAAIIGPTAKGPAFVPTVVRSFQDFETRFGPLDSETFVPQTVQEYLKSAGSVTVCRVLAGGGYTYANGTNEMILLAVSASDATTENTGTVPKNIIVGAILPSKATSKPDLSKTAFVGQGGSGSFLTDFSITLSGSTGGTGATSGTQISASLNPSNQNYIFQQVGDSPHNSKTAEVEYNGTPGFTYINFENLQTSIASAGVAEVTTLTFAAATTASVQGRTSSLYITNADGDQFTLALSMSNNVGLSAHLFKDLPTGEISGSVVKVAAAVKANIQHLSGSGLAQSYSLAINNEIPGVSASVSSNVVTLTYSEAGSVLDVARNTISPVAHTATVAVTTQGTDLSGFRGISATRDILFLTQSSDIVFNGNIGQTEGYSYASTPMITSQFLDPNSVAKKSVVQDLFKFHSLEHGRMCNKDYKISISNLREPSDIDGQKQYSTFSVIIRKYDDTDQSPLILEQFNNCNLDPTSTNYIARVIGDRYPQYNDTLDKVEMLGNYPNISKYCRVEVAEAVKAKSTSPKLSPKGFRAVINPLPSASFDNTFGAMIFPSASYEGVQQIGTDNQYNTKGFLGWKFEEKDKDNENFLKSLPTVQDSNVSGLFNVENFNGHPSSSLWTGALSASIDPTGTTGPKNSQLKFSVPFQGGDDGIRHDVVKFTGGENTLAATYTAGTNLYGFDVSTTSKAGYTGYKKAIDILSNQDEYDINILVIPGAIKQYHSLITNAGINMVEDRGDAFYVMDLVGKDESVNSAVNQVAGLDTNYAAVYYPFVKVLDTSRNLPILVPPSVVVPGAIAQSDNIAAEWFAPAGLNRGVLGNVIEAKIRLNQAERDILYDNKINPIATFPATGVCIWGQKTLQERSTALNRINVRRLLIALKKFIASSSRFLVFEQNTQATRNRFLNIVNPYLESVQQRQGLFAFRVQMDESNNTPEVIDRNQLVGAIFLQPTRTAEFIILDFNVLPTGATFDTGGGAGGY